MCSGRRRVCVKYSGKYSEKYAFADLEARTEAGIGTGKERNEL